MKSDSMFGKMKLNLEKIFCPTCTYCGNKLFFFNKYHDKCKDKHDEGVEKIIGELTPLSNLNRFEALENKIIALEKEHLISDKDRRAIVLKAWEKGTEYVIANSKHDELENFSLENFMSRFSITTQELNKNGLLTKSAQFEILHGIQNGKLPDVNSGEITQINFQKNEKIVWLFRNIDYYEDKLKRQYVRGSRGVSMRIAKGLSYRIGGSVGHSVNVINRVFVSNGHLIVTNKNIYFTSSSKSLRLPYSKIVSFEIYEDGIGVIRDARTAKPQIFVTKEGRFTYDLITSLARL
ncbi:MAG: hypothetical protein WC756_10455 [Taibaiella sp.]